MTTNRSEAAEREMFEAWAKASGYLDFTRHGDGYYRDWLNCCWVGWVAARAASSEAAPVVPANLFGALCHARDIVRSRTIWKAGTPSADHAEALLSDLDAIIAANRPRPDAVQAAPAIPEGETLADRLDWLADRQTPGSQTQSDLFAAATIWRKHLKPSLLTQAAPAARELLATPPTPPSAPATGGKGDNHG